VTTQADRVDDALSKANLEKSDLGTRQGGSTDNVHTKEAFSSTLMTDTDTSRLKAGNESVNLSSCLGIDEEVIHVDYHHRGLAHKETRMKL
jgi:hypothetical protein